VSQALLHAEYQDECRHNENAAAHSKHAGQKAGEQSDDRGHDDPSGRQRLV
jgi:hypothetical protein